MEYNPVNSAYISELISKKKSLRPNYFVLFKHGYDSKVPDIRFRKHHHI